MKTATLYVFLSCDFAVTGLWNGARSLEKLTNGKRCIGNLSSVKFRCKLPSPYSILAFRSQVCSLDLLGEAMIWISR
jgi:hypothetical protein